MHTSALFALSLKLGCARLWNPSDPLIACESCWRLCFKIKSAVNVCLCLSLCVCMRVLFSNFFCCCFPCHDEPLISQSPSNRWDLVEKQMLFCIGPIMNMDAILVHDTQGLRADWLPHHSLKQHPETLWWSLGVLLLVDPEVDALADASSVCRRIVFRKEAFTNNLVEKIIILLASWAPFTGAGSEKCKEKGSDITAHFLKLSVVVHPLKI